MKDRRDLVTGIVFVCIVALAIYFGFGCSIVIHDYPPADIADDNTGKVVVITDNGDDAPEMEDASVAFKVERWQGELIQAIVNYGDICEKCTYDEECESDGGQCVYNTMILESFCSFDCTSRRCPELFFCSNVIPGIEMSQCVPVDMTSTCRDALDGGTY